MIVAMYLLSVGINRLMNMLTWVNKHRQEGVRGYCRQYWPMLTKTALFHVLACPLWVSGIGVGILAAGLQQVPGLQGLTLDPKTVVTPGMTLGLAWIFDSVLSRVAMNMKWLELMGSDEGGA
ncbi:MAG TPA: hypothetical protein VFG76_06810 [Candidatus Polarisedimenticolia bacterium]|nr:hypothetical protein [Candidatus Polarisedimenticolia bacterium]